MNKWETIRDFVKKQRSREITRQTLLWNLQSSDFSETLIDAYRRVLTAAGYLSDGRKPGIYLKAKPIPRHLTLAEATEQAYPGSAERRRKSRDFYRKSEARWGVQ